MPRASSRCRWRSTRRTPCGPGSAPWPWPAAPRSCSSSCAGWKLPARRRGSTGCRSDAGSRWNCGFNWRSCSRWPRWRRAPTSRSCWPASRSGSPWPRSGNRAGCPRQLFAVTEGFLGPLFFVWLGASLDLRDLARHPAYIGVGLALGLGAVVAHCAIRRPGAARGHRRAGRRPARRAGGRSRRLGTQLHLLKPGQPAALLLGALVTIGIAALAAAQLARRRAPTPRAPRSRARRPGRSRPDRSGWIGGSFLR